MTQKKAPSSMTDKQLSQHLASLREEVAAPADFRAKLMLRLQQEGLIQGQPAVVVAQPSLWERLLANLTPARLAMAVAAVVALVFVLPKAPQVATAPAPSGTTSTQKTEQRVVTSGQALVTVGKKKVEASAQASKPETAPDIASAPRPKSEPMPEALLDKSAPVQQQAAVGGASSSSPSQSSHFNGADAAAAPSLAMPGAGLPVMGASAPGAPASSAAVVAKPTVIVVDATPTPVTKPMQGNSELRGNVIRASQGASALFLYKVLKTGHVRVEIHDRLGKLITVLKDEDQNPGTYELRWAGHDDSGGLAPTGIYVLQLHAPQLNAQHKLLLVK